MGLNPSLTEWILYGILLVVLGVIAGVCRIILWRRRRYRAKHPTWFDQLKWVHEPPRDEP